MIKKINYIISNISFFHLNTLFILALALIGGTIGGRIFQKMKIPQVVGYIAIGLFLGQSGMGIIDKNMVQALQPLNYFALGLIGFMIGGELKKSVIKKHGRQFLTILLFEGFLSFILVTVLLGFVGSFLLKDAALAWSLALMLGAISSATAPAATTDVLWEYKSKGPLTTAVFGIVALDDALALILFAMASSLVMRILGASHESLLIAMLHPLYEVGGAILVGWASGRVLIAILKHYDQKDRVLVFLVGMVLFVLGLSVAINVSMILAAMVLGVVVVNGIPNMSKQVFDMLDNFTPPIFVLFFVFIGAKLNLKAVSPLLVILICFYLIGRTAGKMSGAYLGSSLSRAHKSVRKYLPFCLFSQAGVAVGLSIVAAHLMPENLGNMIIIIITASTLVVQLIGPPCVKWAITKAQEAGKNITEEDLMRTIKVSELVDLSYPIIKESTPLETILRIFSDSSYTQYPVVNNDGKLTGTINIDSIKNSMLLEDSGNLLLGDDIKQPFHYATSSHSTIFEAKAYMDKFHLGFIPVVDEKESILGCFDRRMYQKFVSTKLLQLQQDENL